MRHPFVLAVTGAALSLWAAGSATAQPDGPQARLIQVKAAPIVSVEFVLQITTERDGRSRDQERRGRVTGIVVDPSGLVMVPAAAFEAPAARFGRGGRRGRGGRASDQGAKRTAKPSSIRVVFPDSDKEHTAILGAKDTKFGLAFVQVTDLGDTEVPSLDLAKIATPRVGQSLFGVTRLGQGFDHAAICDVVRVMGAVTKPHGMWAISDRGLFVGTTLYTADGAVAGLCAMQAGVGQNAGRRVFLLPMNAVLRVAGNAKTEAQRAWKELREAEAKAKADAEAEAAQPADADGEAKPSDDK